MQFFRALILYINFLLDIIFLLAYLLFRLCVCVVKLSIPSCRKKSLQNEIVLVSRFPKITHNFVQNDLKFLQI